MKAMPRFPLPLPLALLLALPFCPGCATFQDPPARITVGVKDASHFEVAGMIYGIDQLPRQVRKTGARPETEIMMQMPDDFPRSSLLPAYAALQKAGFKRILFSTPREVTTRSDVRAAAATNAPPIRSPGKLGAPVQRN